MRVLLQHDSAASSQENAPVRHHTGCCWTGIHGFPLATSRFAKSSGLAQGETFILVCVFIDFICHKYYTFNKTLKHTRQGSATPPPPPPTQTVKIQQRWGWQRAWGWQWKWEFLNRKQFCSVIVCFVQIKNINNLLNNYNLSRCKKV